jgi:thiamine biosynthesis lipoprotein
MGTFATVALPERFRDTLPEVARQAAGCIQEVEEELSDFIPGSLISRINSAAGGGRSLELTPHTANVFRLSQRGFTLSSGAFDPTVGPLVKLWGFRSRTNETALPSPNDIAAALDRVGWLHLQWEGSDGAALSRSGMWLDFGAVGKGYGVDVAFDQLRANDCADFMVNLGGNLRCAGSARQSRKGWAVAVRDPFLPYGRGSVGTLTLSSGRATATSGRYEKFVEIGGRRYAHVIDPRTGYPVKGMAQVTVVADSAAEADVLSTALFVLGMEAGTAMLVNYAGATALFIPDPPDGQAATAWSTHGFTQEFSASENWAPHIQTIMPQR